MSELERLRQKASGLDGKELLAAMVTEFPGAIAITSSFGAEAVVLLDLVAQVDKSLPVLFIDTNELFDETLGHRDQVISLLGLTNVQAIRPNAEELTLAEELWHEDPDRCCLLRKVLPLERAKAGYRALVDGRKRFHGGGREALQGVEQGEDGLFKISPLFNWSEQRIEAAFAERKLPRHPLVAQGYRSIGCWPCSRPIQPGEPIRSGRWAGAAKTECGIHRTTKPS